MLLQDELSIRTLEVDGTPMSVVNEFRLDVVLLASAYPVSGRTTIESFSATGFNSVEFKLTLDSKERLLKAWYAYASSRRDASGRLLSGRLLGEHPVRVLPAAESAEFGISPDDFIKIISAPSAAARTQGPAAGNSAGRRRATRGSGPVPAEAPAAAEAATHASAAELPFELQVLKSFNPMLLCVSDVTPAAEGGELITLELASRFLATFGDLYSPAVFQDDSSDAMVALGLMVPYLKRFLALHAPNAQ